MSDQQKITSGSNCGGCLGGFLLVAGAAIIFSICTGPEDFYLAPGEANQSIEAIQQTFDELDRILPDSLIITEELDPYQHYMSAESFGNIFYGVNPVLNAAAKADTSRKYKFQYIARVDHVDYNEFVIRDFLIDSIWRDIPFETGSENPFGSVEE